MYAYSCSSTTPRFLQILKQLSYYIIHWYRAFSFNRVLSIKKFSPYIKRFLAYFRFLKRTITLFSVKLNGALPLFRIKNKHIFFLFIFGHLSEVIFSRILALSFFLIWIEFHKYVMCIYFRKRCFGRMRSSWHENQSGIK